VKTSSLILPFLFKVYIFAIPSALYNNGNGLSKVIYLKKTDEKAIILKIYE
jgi:hypothetical protein